MVLMLAVLFGGWGVGQVAPQSWFGAQVGTLFGGFGYFCLVWIVSSVIEWGFRRMGIPFVRPLATQHDAVSREPDPLS